MKQTERRAVIALDLGGTNLRIAGVTRTGEVLFLYRERTRATAGPRDLIDRMVDGIDKVQAAIGVEGWETIGVSIGAPGVISRREGVVMSSPNLPGWEGLRLVELLRTEIDLPIILENDANAAVFGEFWAGSGKGRSTIVLITLGTGVGGGIIIDGKLLVGADGMAGEIGHLTVEREGEPCPCGNRGCLERYASATGIAARYRALSQGGPPGEDRGDEATAAAVHERAEGGDLVAARVFAEAGMYLGTAMAAIVNIVNPECIIIGGGVLPAWNYIVPAARSEMLSRAFQAPAERVDILPAALGDRAGIIGAAGIIWEGGIGGER